MTNKKLDEKFLEKIKSFLLDEKEKLEKNFSKIAEKDGRSNSGYTTAFPQYGEKEEDNVTEVADFAANISIEQDLEKHLRDIKNSLIRIEEGDYGICKYCQKPIDEKRLLARPTSSSCIECKKTITQEL